MKIALISVGRLKTAHFKDGAEDYLKRLGHYAPIEVIEVKDASGADADTVKKKEAASILKALKAGDCVVALDERGEGKTSKELSRFIEKVTMSGVKRMCFVVGGSYGLGEEVTKKAVTVLSLSKMTLPHEMARLVLAEQLYRAYTILKGEPYSH